MSKGVCIKAQALFSDEGLSKGERDSLHNNKKIIDYYLKKKKLDSRDLVHIPVNRRSGIFFYPKRQHPDFVLELVSFPVSEPLYLNDVGTMKEVKEFIDKTK